MKSTHFYTGQTGQGGYRSKPPDIVERCFFLIWPSYGSRTVVLRARAFFSLHRCPRGPCKGPCLRSTKSVKMTSVTGPEIVINRWGGEVIMGEVILIPLLKLEITRLRRTLPASQFPPRKVIYKPWYSTSCSKDFL